MAGSEDEKEARATKDVARAEREESEIEERGFNRLAAAIRDASHQPLFRGHEEEFPRGQEVSGPSMARSQTPLTIAFLLVIAVGVICWSADIPPIVLALAAMVIFGITLLRWYPEDFSNPVNIFFFIFLIWHLFIDAARGFSWGPVRYSALFVFGILHWALFIRPSLPPLSVGSLKAWLYSILAPVVVWQMYGLSTYAMVYIAKLGIGQANLNIILVLGPLLVFVFLFPRSYFMKTVQNIVLTLTLLALVSWVYQAGLAGSGVIPGLETSGYTADTWGALGNFGLLFWNPIRDGAISIYQYLVLPACNVFFFYVSKFISWLVIMAGGSGEIVVNYCPAGQGVNISGYNQTAGGGLSGWIDRRIAFATGQVEETKTEPPGVTLAPIELQASAVEGQPVTVKSRVHAVALDKPLDINVFCKATGEKVNATADEVIPGKTVKVRAKEKVERGIVCLYNYLPAQVFSFLMSTSFEFKTVSYLKVYFASDAQIDAAGSRQAWFDRYRIFDRDPEPKFTPGPIAMGARVEEPMPIILYSRTPAQKIFLNIPVQNSYQGRLRKIDRFIIALPKGLILDGVYGGKEKGVVEEIRCADLPVEDARGCDDGLFSFYDVAVGDTDVSGIQYRAILSVVDFAALLGKAAPSTQFIKVTLDYDYVIEQRSAPLHVEKAADIGEVLGGSTR